jgi:FixJ family two-component response regulator
MSLISIVDDDAFARDAIGQLIESLGYRILIFPCAEEFLESGRIEETACLITDLRMPGMSGLDLQSHLRSNGYFTPIVFVSALREQRLATRAMDGGAVAFLSKPLEESALIECIGIALARRRGDTIQT